MEDSRARAGLAGSCAGCVYFARSLFSPKLETTRRTESNFWKLVSGSRNINKPVSQECNEHCKQCKRDPEWNKEHSSSNVEVLFEVRS